MKLLFITLVVLFLCACVAPKQSGTRSKHYTPFQVKYDQYQQRKLQRLQIKQLK